MINRISWFEVLGKNPAALQKFYGEMFDWNLQADEQSGYATAAPDEENIPGGVGPAPDGVGWSTFYVHVDNVESAITRAEGLGAKVLMPPTVLPEATIAVIADPEGHPVGLAQDA